MNSAEKINVTASEPLLMQFRFIKRCAYHWGESNQPRPHILRIAVAALHSYQCCKNLNSACNALNTGNYCISYLKSCGDRFFFSLATPYSCFRNCCEWRAPRVWRANTNHPDTPTDDNYDVCVYWNLHE